MEAQRAEITAVKEPTQPPGPGEVPALALGNIKGGDSGQMPGRPRHPYLLLPLLGWGQQHEGRGKVPLNPFPGPAEKSGTKEQTLCPTGNSSTRLGVYDSRNRVSPI